MDEEAEEDVSNSSSSYEQSNSSDDDSDSDSSKTNRKNIIQNHIDECELSGGESSVSFHDDSDFDSDADDLEMVDYFRILMTLKKKEALILTRKGSILLIGLKKGFSHLQGENSFPAGPSFLSFYQKMNLDPSTSHRQPLLRWIIFNFTLMLV